MIPYELVIPRALGPAANLAPAISCPAGATVGVALAVPRRGALNKVRVVQLSGPLEGFSYALYNTVAACDPAAAGAPQGATNAVLHQITPLLVVASPNPAYVSAEGYPEDGVSNLDLAYACMDDAGDRPLMGNPSDAARKIYLKITAAGGGATAKTFGVALTVIDLVAS